jgi:hypothetical protein
LSTNDYSFHFEYTHSSRLTIETAIAAEHGQKGSAAQSSLRQIYLNYTL